MNKLIRTSQTWLRHLTIHRSLLLLVVFFLTFSVALQMNQGFLSSEVKFTDASSHGLLIMPASCPSNPHLDPRECTSAACSLAPSRSTVQAGDSFQLTWRSERVPPFEQFNEYHQFDGTINHGVGAVHGAGQAVLSGSVSVAIPVTQRDGLFVYTLRGQDSFNNFVQFWYPTPVACSAEVMVKAADAPRCTISASPSTVQPGDHFELQYTTVNADSASINNDVGTVPVGADQSHGLSAPDETTAYTMTVARAGKTNSCTAQILVDNGAPTCTISAVPRTLEQGTTFKFVYSTLHATSASIDHAVGIVDTGTNLERTWTAPQTSTVYTMTVQGEDGATGTCQAPMTIVTPAPSCSIEATPSRVNPGQAFTFSYSTENATAAFIDRGIGPVTVPSGTRRVFAPDVTQTYTMTVSNESGRSATCPVTVTVNSQCQDGPPQCVSGQWCQCIGGQFSCSGTCVSNADSAITVSPTLLRKGDRTTVSWTTQGVTSCTVRGTNGDGPWNQLNETGRLSSPIRLRTTFTLSCGGLPAKSATVNVIPTFEEQ